MARMKMNAIGRWEIYGGMDRLQKVELNSGDVVHVEVEGIDELQPTRIEFVHTGKGGGCYASVDDYPLWDGMRAEIDTNARR